MKKRNKNKKSGFTLIELVVVIAIIGVLAAVITPRVRLSLAKAKDSRAIAIVDALRTASNVYYAEKGVSVFGTTGGTVKAGVTALSAAGYLDAKADSKFVDDTLLVGTTACTGTPAKPSLDGGTIALSIDTDRIGINIETSTSTKVDTNCDLWKDK